MTEQKQPLDLRENIRRMNLVEKDELEALGQFMNEKGDILTSEKKANKEKKKKKNRFKLLIASLFLGMSLNAGPISDNTESVGRDRTEQVEFDENTLQEENSENTSNNEVPTNPGERFGFNYVETDSSSPDHENNLENDDYAQSYLFDVMIADLRRVDEVVKSGENGENMNFSFTDAVTRVYFRRDDLGNPILGVYNDPEVLAGFIKDSGERFFNVGVGVGWSEYRADQSERRFPELTQYTVNGETVFHEEPYLITSRDEEGNEVLLQEAYDTVNLSEMTDQEKAQFLLSEVSLWSEDEYRFLLDGGYIEESDGLYDEVDEGYYNESGSFKYRIGRLGLDRSSEPQRRGFEDTFLIPIRNPVNTYSEAEAQRIREEGLVVQLDGARDRSTEAYTEDAIFHTPDGDWTAVDNQRLLNNLATANPGVFLLAPIGDNRTSFDVEEPEPNLIPIALYQRGASPSGADFYVYSSSGEIGSSFEAAQYLLGLSISGETDDPKAYFDDLATVDYVWRGSGADAYEEEIKVIDQS